MVHGTFGKICVAYKYVLSVLFFTIKSFQESLRQSMQVLKNFFLTLLTSLLQPIFWNYFLIFSFLKLSWPRFWKHEKSSLEIVSRGREECGGKFWNWTLPTLIIIDRVYRINYNQRVLIFLRGQRNLLRNRGSFTQWKCAKSVRECYINCSAKI